MVAIIGIIIGQIYRSDIASFNTYRLSPPVVTLSRWIILPFVGSLRAPRRSTRAFPENFHAQQTRLVTPGNDEVVTTSRSATQESSRRIRNANTNVGVGDSAAISRSSVMREWVDELTGRADRINSGMPVPTEAEISQLTTMFPAVRREVVVRALQGRLVTTPFLVHGFNQYSCSVEILKAQWRLSCQPIAEMELVTVTSY